MDEHCHESAVEVMYCVSGCGMATVGDQIYRLTENAMIAAAPGELHCIKNTGSETLRCLCIFSPPTTAENLRRRAEDAVAASRGKTESAATPTA